MGAARRDPRRGEIPVGRCAVGRSMTSQYVRGVKDKWHITRKQIGFCISPEMGQVLWPAPFSGLLNIQEVSLCERLSGVAICSMQT